MHVEAHLVQSDVGDPLDPGRQVVTTRTEKTTPLDLDGELHAQAAQLAVDGVLPGVVHLPAPP